LRKKEGRRTYQGQYRDKASPSFRRDRDKGACWDLLFLRWGHNGGRGYRTVTAGAGNSSLFGGTSYSGGTMTEGPGGTGTSSLFWRDYNSFGMQQQDLLFSNVHALRIGDHLFIIHNVCHQLEWRDRFVMEAAEVVS
jgi:hypothetical protein